MHNVSTQPLFSRLIHIAQGLGLGCALFGGSAMALTYPLPADDIDVIGQVERITAVEEDTLLSLGREYGIGYEEMRQANPDVDVWLPGEGTEVVIPSQFILPEGERNGIVVNIAEMRLYYYPPVADGQPASVETYPISVGRMDWSTPLGESQITEKTENPYWFPPESILTERAQQGRPLPDAVPPGPENPLGKHKMRLSIPGGAYLIHGTNEPRGIGMRVTHGCIRMFPEDVESLFERVPSGENVRLVNEAVKAGWTGERLLVEAHPVLPEDAQNAYDPLKPPPLSDAIASIALVIKRHENARIDHQKLADAVANANGMPTPISRQRPTIPALALQQPAIPQVDKE